jgi:hypothetical protein
MKKENLGGFALGLLGLAVSVYVIGYAWRVSQSRKKSPGGLTTGDDIREYKRLENRAAKGRLATAEEIEELKRQSQRVYHAFDGVYN